ncbi:MAG: family 20 glycosylhydrolase [Muribaculaceae bacterium]|nr:family 20 glycosylhydrolase [Muribaculaceae bacterium]
MRNNLLLLLVAVALATFAVACTKAMASKESSVQVHWQAENLPVDSTGVNYYLQTITVTGDLADVERLCFNQFNRPMEMLNPADTLIELVPNYHCIASPRFKEAAKGDTLVFEIKTRGFINAINYSPDSFHVVRSDGSTEATAYTRFDISADPRFYAREGSDLMPYGDSIYAINERIMAEVEQSPYNVVPSFKKVTLTGGESTVNMAKIKFEQPKGAIADGEYTITVADNAMTVTAPRRQWAQLKKRLTYLYGDKEISLPNAVINDRPTYPYRGLMIDIARNFQTPEQMRRVIDLMAIYGLNTLHFHPVDDEAWRVEIPALPELTTVGARHGYGFESGEYLPQFYAGDGNPNTVGGTANGYMTRAEYIDMIRYADSLGITVIPEIESPGHARAAIYAMKHRAAKTGDRSLLLTEEGDTSVYSTPQAFHDNIMNPALEGPYKFMDIVADAFIDMHREAGVPLEAIHIGGDEVPHSAWSGSPAIAALSQKEGLDGNKEIHAYFVKRLADSFAKKGVKLSGWQEIALRHSNDYNKAVAPRVYSVNCWNTLPVKGQNIVANDLAAAGYPIVLSNVEHFYLDMVYSHNPDERGLNWGGSTDEFKALNGYPAVLCTAPGANIIGISGQVFAETIRNRGNQEMMLLPKMLGLAERAWNPEPTYTDAAFHEVILGQIPKWERDGLTYHVRQPGIKLVDDGAAFVVNSPYPDAVIRYTTDGSKPTEQSPVVKPGEKIPTGDATHIRATLWLNNHPSATTLLLR